MNTIFPKKCNLAQKQFVRVIYSFLVQLTWYLLRFIAKFNAKIKLFVQGRKRTFPILKKDLVPGPEVIWMHVASLGEYEQGLPLLEALKRDHPQYKIVLSFFSPSGYEVKKDKTPADVVVYLPLDTQKNAVLFLDRVSPKMAIFIKYEIWPNYLHELKKRKITTVLVSGIFSKRQSYFKWYGNFMKNALSSFSHFFVQEENSRKLLHSIGFENVSIGGDTRFDRVSEIRTQPNTLNFMEGFKGSSKCLVAGSTWPEDEAVLLDFINASDTKLKIVLAPHNIKAKHVLELKSSITKKVMLYSEWEDEVGTSAEVLIVDTIGLLTKIYSYADFAYVGGGFATGLHNTLEPAVFGIPVLIGPNYTGFNEAEELVNERGVLPVKNKKAFEMTIKQLVEDVDFAKQTGQNNDEYIQQKIGATKKVMDYLKPLL